MSDIIVSSSVSASSGGSRRHVTISGTCIASPVLGSRSSSTSHVSREPTPLGSTHTSCSSMSAKQQTPPDSASLYMRPMVQSAVRRWKRLHEQAMMEKLLEMRNDKKNTVKTSRDEARKMARKIPTELLAQEWLKDNKATIEIRAYLVDKVLPTLILGVEKLLTEADNRGLAEVEVMESNFNPLNYLAQYLMRNNPRYSNFSESSPYVRSLREVAEELRKQLFTIKDNRLARIKAEAKRKREVRERQEALLLQEKTRREESLQNQFQNWNVSPAGRVELCLLQNALKSFAELVEQYPEELQQAARFAHTLEPTDETGKTLNDTEFTEYMSQYIDTLPSVVFDQFMSHIDKCAAAHRASAQREARRIQLTNLFISCDHSGIGILDRHRILNLFEKFYDSGENEIHVNLRNPRRWPVVEVEEADDSLSDEEEEPEKKPETTGSVEELAKIEGAGSDTKVLDDEASNHDRSVVVASSGENSFVATSNEKIDDVTPSVEQTVDVTFSAEKTADFIPTDQKSLDMTSSEELSVDVVSSEEKSIDLAPSVDKMVEVTSSAEKTVDVTSSESKIVDVTSSEDKVDATSSESKTVVVTSSDSKAVDVTSSESKTVDVTSSEDQVTEEEEGAALGVNKIDKKAAVDTDAIAEERKVEDQTDNVVEKNAADGTAGDEPKVQENPVSSNSLNVTFAQGTEFEREKTNTSINSRSQSQLSAFDENTLNVSQFVGLTETFLGDVPDKITFKNLLQFLKQGYEETEDEKMTRLIQARKEALSAKRKVMMDQLFERWDNDGSGFLEMDEMEIIMLKYKNGQDTEAIKAAEEEMKKHCTCDELRLCKREFRLFIEAIVEGIPGADTFDYFMDFLTNSIERSHAERVRGEARKKWLQKIVIAAETSGGSMEPVYKEVFQALFKDAENHGGGKKISANISMLERNSHEPERGPVHLRYVAATLDDADHVLGKILYKDMKGVSFSSVETGKPIHVPRVANHGNIHFWNPQEQKKEGSFIVVPLKDKKKRVFGLLGVDTLNDPHTKAIFITHEIQYFQGVAKAFSIAYHHVDLRKKLMKITESAVSWIQRRSPHVHEITVYMVEPDGRSIDYVLRKMMYTDVKGKLVQHDNPPRLERKDNLFRDYLFKSVDNSESVTADAYGERHLSFPLRDDQGHAVAAIDISIGNLKKLPPLENKETLKMLRLLQAAHKEITREFAGAETNRVLDAEKDDDTRIDIMFDRIMLQELRENLSKLDGKSYAELSSYNQPPKIVHDILKATLAVFNLDKAKQREYDDWSKVKGCINSELAHQISLYDPTSEADLFDPADVEIYLKDVPHGEVLKHGSLPAQHMYNWVFVTLSLVEHTLKNRVMEEEEEEVAEEPTKSVSNVDVSKEETLTEEEKESDVEVQEET